MENLNKKDISILSRYIDSELLERWKGLEKKNLSNNCITIANTGLFSSGKSQLFNALLDRIENERFPVGAIPTTKIGDREKYSDRIEFIDTPGIDAKSEDDEVAFAMLMESDIILITHNIKSGMLGRSEFEWIKKIAEGMQVDERRKRMIFVATWIDAVADQEDYRKIIEEIRKQIYSATEVELDFWEVSSKRYYTAKLKRNDKLEKKSNIPRLRESLINYAENYEKESAIDNEKELLSEQILQRLRERTTVIEKSLDEISKKHRKISNEKLKLWKSKLERFKSLRGDIEDKIADIKNEDTSSSFSSFKNKILDI